MMKLPLVIVLDLLVLMGCAGLNKKISQRQGFNRPQNMQKFYKTKSVKPGEEFKGKASYNGPGFHGKLTASGEVYDQNAMTCAHKTLPFQTKLLVTNLSNQKSVEVVVTDRGPYKDDRILDLSVGAAKKIGLIEAGVAKVSAKIISDK